MKIFSSISYSDIYITSIKFHNAIILYPVGMKEAKRGELSAIRYRIQSRCLQILSTYEKAQWRTAWRPTPEIKTTNNRRQLEDVIVGYCLLFLHKQWLAMRVRSTREQSCEQHVVWHVILLKQKYLVFCSKYGKTCYIFIWVMMLSF